MEFQLQHQSFQRTPRTDLLQNELVGSPCSLRDSQESFPTPQFKSINSSVLSLLHSPTLISIHDHWKNHSLYSIARTKTKLPGERPYGGRKLGEVTSAHQVLRGEPSSSMVTGAQGSSRPRQRLCGYSGGWPAPALLPCCLLPSQLRASDLETGQDGR